VSSEATSSPHTATSRPTAGGRACPPPVALAALRGPFGMRKPQREVTSTGVITADVLDWPAH
jgi:hypothetical protein